MINNDELINTIANSLEIDKSNLENGTILDELEEFDSLGALSVFTAISQKLMVKKDKIDLTNAKTIQNSFEIWENNLTS